MFILEVCVNNILCWEDAVAAEKGTDLGVEFGRSFTEVTLMFFSEEEIDEVMNVVEMNELVGR